MDIQSPLGFILSILLMVLSTIVLVIAILLTWLPRMFRELQKITTLLRELKERGERP